MKKIGIVLLSLLCGYVAYTQNYNEYNNIKLGDNLRAKGHFEGVGFRLTMVYTSSPVKSTNFIATLYNTGK